MDINYNNPTNFIQNDKSLFYIIQLHFDQQTDYVLSH